MEKYKRWSRLVARNIHGAHKSLNFPRCRITKSEVTHELFMHHASWRSKISLKKFLKTFSWGLDAGKLKTEQKLIVLPCLHSPPYLFWRKIGTQSHSAKFLNWCDHVNSVPDLAASPPDSKIDFVWNLLIPSLVTRVKGTQSAIGPRWPGHYLCQFEKCLPQPEIKSQIHGRIHLEIRFNAA